MYVMADFSRMGTRTWKSRNSTVKGGQPSWTTSLERQMAKCAKVKNCNSPFGKDSDKKLLVPSALLLVTSPSPPATRSYGNRAAPDLVSSALRGRPPLLALLLSWLGKTDGTGKNK